MNQYRLHEEEMTSIIQLNHFEIKEYLSVGDSLPFEKDIQIEYTRYNSAEICPYHMRATQHVTSFEKIVLSATTDIYIYIDITSLEMGEYKHIYIAVTDFDGKEII